MSLSSAIATILAASVAGWIVAGLILYGLWQFMFVA